MKPIPLSKEEESFVTDSGDKIILEIIKGMSLEELREFDIYKAKSLKHYNDMQCTWLHTERHLIGHREGHKDEVSVEELIEDIHLHNNGERFRVFYVLKYPTRVERTQVK
jgi:hypothetical protein